MRSKILLEDPYNKSGPSIIDYDSRSLEDGLDIPQFCKIHSHSALFTDIRIMTVNPSVGRSKKHQSFTSLQRSGACFTPNWILTIIWHAGSCNAVLVPCPMSLGNVVPSLVQRYGHWITLHFTSLFGTVLRIIDGQRQLIRILVENTHL